MESLVGATGPHFYVLAFDDAQGSPKGFFLFYGLPELFLYLCASPPFCRHHLIGLRGHLAFNFVRCIKTVTSSNNAWLRLSSSASRSARARLSLSRDSCSSFSRLSVSSLIISSSRAFCSRLSSSTMKPRLGVDAACGSVGDMLFVFGVPGRDAKRNLLKNLLSSFCAGL